MSGKEGKRGRRGITTSAHTIGFAYVLPNGPLSPLPVCVARIVRLKL